MSSPYINYLGKSFPRRGGPSSDNKNKGKDKDVKTTLQAVTLLTSDCCSEDFSSSVLQYKPVQCHQISRTPL